MNLAGVLFFVQCRGTKRRWTFWHGTGQTFLAVFPHPPSGAGQPGNQRPPASRKSRRSYRGPGSGIKRALEDWPDIEFTDDREGCLFTATVHRREVGGSEKGSPKIIELIRQSPTIAIPEIAQHVGVTDRAIKKQIEKLKIQGRIRRIGPARGGHPEVIE